MTGAISPPGNGIFISYRRADTAYPAGWLFELLAARFGADRVFKDVDSVQPGDDFVEEIRAAVGSCGVLLAVIGKHWLAMASEDGRRRLDNPADMVRLEIEAALERDVRVIPVLVDGASMPGTAQLPRSLSKLAYRQAVELSPQRFSSDARRLIRTLDQELAHDPAPTAPSGAEAPTSAGVPDPVETKLRTASADVQRWLRRFVQEQVKIHGADVVPGPGDLKYLRLTLPGARRKAAYCYVTTRGYVDFRLPKTAAQDRQHAYARDVKDDGTNCAVRLHLNSQGALNEALQLAAEAAEASQISPEQRSSPTASSVSSAPEGEPAGAGDTGRRLAVMKRFDVPAGEGLDREQASRAFTENGYNPRSFGGWVRRGWITRDGDRRYLTGKGRQWGRRPGIRSHGNWKLILAAAGALTAAGQAPFTRLSVYGMDLETLPRGLLGKGTGLLERSRRLGLSLNTVKRYARAAEPERMIRAPKYRATLVDPYRDHLRARRAEDPAVPARRLPPRSANRVTPAA